MSEAVRIGVLGFGGWGPNHVRNFNGIKESEVILIADPDASRRAQAQQQWPFCRVVSDSDEVLASDEVDAVVVSTPLASHFDLSLGALEAGKDVLCEKPLASTVTQCERLVGEAEERSRILHVGHVFLFNAGILKLKEIIDYGDLGSLYYFHAVRTNLGPFRLDTNAVGDLATHDISIFDFLLGSSPEAVSATGMRCLQDRQEDVAFITLYYPRGVLANILVSWLDPMKVRRITAVGAKKMAVWDDLGSLGPVTIYEKGVVREPDYADWGEFQLRVKEGEITIPRVRQAEPLRLQAEHFLQSVRTRSAPFSDGRFGAEVVRVMEAVNRSIEEAGARVEVGSGR
jgi:predicted dehydrogenase